MKFRTKVTVLIISLISIFYSVGSTVLISVSFQNSLEREKQFDLQSYKMILSTLQVISSSGNLVNERDISNVIDKFEKQNSKSYNSLKLYTKDRILYRTGEVKNDFVDIKKNIDSNHCQIINFSKGKKKFFQITSMFKLGKNKIYLDAAYDISSIYEQRKQQQIIYYYVFAIVLAFCGFVSYVMAVILTRRLYILSKTSRAISKGNISARSKIQGEDEIGILASEFDRMADSIEKNIYEMKAEMERENQFVGNFTHELKTPMTSIIGYSDLIRSETLSKEEEIEAANYIFSEAKRLERLSLKLLEIFVLNNDEITFVRTSPKSLIENIVRILQNNYRSKKIVLSSVCEKGTCYMEPDLIRSLITNLIDNAGKAIEASGEIKIVSRMTQNGCIIQVQDNGKGMPQYAINHITEAFYRVDKSRARKKGGAGLGLTLCSKIVEIHSGKIDIESEEEKGTIITIYIERGR